MVQLIPENHNPTQQEIDAYIFEMVNRNNHYILNGIITNIKNKKNVGASLHPSEEYFVDSVFKCVNNTIFETLLQSING